MRRARWLWLFVLLGLVGASGAISGNSQASTLTWGHAIQVPGTSGDQATVNSVSCPTAGTCAVGGGFTYAHSTPAFVVDEKNGNWGTAKNVRFASGGNRLGYVSSVSCATAGNCTAIGNYHKDESSGRFHAFVVEETHGSWGSAIEVPGTATLRSQGSALMLSVSCATPGNCAAGGQYSHGDYSGAFVVDETNGSWGKAIKVPGLDTLPRGTFALVQSISCPTAGNCAAGGVYTDGSKAHAFVVDETNGSWGAAIDVPGTATLNTAGDADVASISCTTAGNCSAGGYYRDGSGYQAFVVDETNGSWGTAVEVPGTATLNSGGDGEVNSISCAADGDCAAGGFYISSNKQQAFVVDETNGSWGSAIEVPGAETLNSGGSAAVDSVSCATGGNCTAGGHFYAGGHRQVFVADETDGIWDNAIQVPGIATLNRGGYANLNSVSCGAARVCVVGGYYTNHHGTEHALVAGSGTRALTVPSAPHLESAAPGDTTIKATWSKPADKGGVPLAGYRVTARAGTHVFTCSTKSKLGCTIAGLRNGTTYTVTVVAENTVGRSTPSNSKRARPRA
jgi:fibronectin type III domain protein